MSPPLCFRVALHVTSDVGAPTRCAARCVHRRGLRPGSGNRL